MKPPRKNNGIENFKPKKAFDNPRHVKSGVPRLRPNQIKNRVKFLFT